MRPLRDFPVCPSCPMAYVPSMQPASWLSSPRGWQSRELILPRLLYPGPGPCDISPVFGAIAVCSRRLSREGLCPAPVRFVWRRIFYAVVLVLLARAGGCGWRTNYGRPQLSAAAALARGALGEAPGDLQRLRHELLPVHAADGVLGLLLGGILHHGVALQRSRQQSHSTVLIASFWETDSHTLPSCSPSGPDPGKLQQLHHALCLIMLLMAQSAASYIAIRLHGIALVWRTGMSSEQSLRAAASAGFLPAARAAAPSLSQASSGRLILFIHDIRNCLHCNFRCIGKSSV